MSQADDRVLETLNETGLTLSPHVLAYNLDYSKAHISRRLGLLLEAKLVKKETTGMYTISDRGRAYLSGNLEADDLERDE